MYGIFSQLLERTTLRRQLSDEERRTAIMHHIFLMIWVCMLQAHIIECFTQTVETTAFFKFQAYSNVYSECNVTKQHTFDCLLYCSVRPTCSVVSYEKENGTCVESVSTHATSENDQQSSSIETYIKRGSGSFYLLDLVPRIFDDAVDNCKVRGGHLVYIESDEEHAVIRDMIMSHSSSGSFTWVGAMRGSFDNKIYWLDGTLLPDSDTKWAGNQPDNSGGAEDCVHLFPDHNYYLNDINCAVQMQSVCEFTF